MEQKKSEFDKVLGAWDILVIAFGAMIGWGWVVSSGSWIQKGGVVGASIAFAIGGVMIFFIGLTYAELTAAMPQCGGEHVFSYKAMGPNGSFICTWAIILGYVSVTCFEACAFPTIITYLWPGFLKGYMYSVAGFDIYASWVAVAVIVAFLITLINVLGAKTAAVLQTVLTCIIGGAGILLIVASVINGDSSNLQGQMFVGESTGTMFQNIIKVAVVTPFFFIGFDVIRSLGICDVLFIFGAIGMVAGSINATRAKTTRMMVAYSSVAQIGYIFAALGLGSELGVMCALWHTLAHSATKSMLFISAHTLDHASGDTHLRKDLRGAFYRSPLAAAAFTLGAANLVGVPMLSVFITKVTMAQAAVMTGGRHTVIALCALAVSTLLNAYYFLGTTMQLYIPDHEHPERNARVKINVYAAIGLVGFIALNLTLSFCAQGIFGALLDGLTRFA